MLYILANQKGGVGKTTLATNLTVALSNKGTTALLDADPQQSSYKWAQRSEHDFHSEHIFFDPNDAETLRKRVKELKKEYEYVVVDMAGADTKAFRSVLFEADKLIVPTQPSQTDIEVLPLMVKLVLAVKQTNTNLKPFIVINKAPSNSRSTEVDEVQALLATVPHVKHLKTVIRDRKQFRDAMRSGESVLGMGSSKAKDEFNEFLVEIL